MMRRVIRSSENRANRRSRKHNMDSAYNSVVYNQVKTALWESQAEEINKCSTQGLAIAWFFRFCFRLRQPSFHWIISDGVVNGIGRNGNILILPTPIPSSLCLRLRLRFSLGQKVSYDSDYDSVASENQPLKNERIRRYFLLLFRG